jgi:hypothetical protein
MYLVTPEFQTGIYSNSRRVYGRVTFDISPTGIEDDTPAVSVSSEFFISNAAQQITDNIRQSTYYLVTWEPDRVTLGGQFTFPADLPSGWGEVGWASGSICNANNTFATTLPSTLPAAMLAGSSNEVVILTYANTYTSAGLTITFDPLFVEYATDFNITAFDGSNNIVFSTSVTGNTLVQYVLIQQIVGFKKLNISISKWSKPYRRARISEIDAGVVLVYENDKLVRMNSTEELDPLSSSLVIPEFSFTVDNKGGEFDILNPTGIYQSLQLRQRIQAELGLDLVDHVEWVPVGIYYLSEWRSDLGAMTATFRGRSKLDLLESTKFENLNPMISYSLADMAVDVLNAAGVTGYYIDPYLDTILTNGLIKSSTCKEVLQMIAMAGQATIKVLRNDTLSIMVSSPLNPIVSYVDFDQMKEEAQIDQGKPVDSVSVSYYTTLGDPDGTVLVTNAGVIKGEVIDLSGNTLINTFTQATDVANWLNNTRSQNKEFTINFRGNPPFELYDYIEIENRYTTGQYMYITKIDMGYEGYLYGQIKGKAAN